MFDTFKNMIKKRQLESELQIKQLEFDKKQFDLANKIVSEARNEIIDDDFGWSALGKQTNQELTEQEQSDMLISAYNLYHNNTYARSIISNLVKFTLGKGPLVIPDDENKKVKETWEKFKNDNKFNLREKEIGVRTFRDGEVFLREFKNEKTGEEPSYKLRFVRAHLIANPNGISVDSNVSFGIRTSPDDIEEVIEYYITDENKKVKETIPADKMIHFKILSDFDQKRGTSILRVVAKRIKQYDEWLEDRIFLNKIRTAITLIKKVPGNSAQIKKVRDDGLSDRTSQDRMFQKSPRRGTVITASKDIEYEMLSPNIQAQDVKDDGRAILLGIASAVGFPEMILTADYANANYSSTLIAQNPFVKGIEDWQDQFSTLYNELFKRVIEYNIEYGDLPAETKTTCRIEFPPMISANLKEIAEAFEIIYKYKVVSKKTWQSKMGLDSDIEDANMEGEEEDFLNVNPNQLPAPGQAPNGQPNTSGKFNLPMAPVNQYNSKLIDYIDNKDWKSFKEEVEKIGGIPEEVSNKLIDTLEIMLFENIHSDQKEKEVEKAYEHEKEIAIINRDGLIESKKQEKPTIINIATPDVKVNVTTPEVKNEIVVEATKIEPAQVNVTTPEIKVDNHFVRENIVVNNQMDKPEVKIENIVEQPVINITPNIEVKQPNIQIDNIIEQKKSKKIVNRDEEGNVISIEESFNG